MKWLPWRDPTGRLSWHMLQTFTNTSKWTASRHKAPLLLPLRYSITYTLVQWLSEKKCCKLSTSWLVPYSVCIFFCSSQGLPPVTKSSDCKIRWQVYPSTKVCRLLLLMLWYKHTCAFLGGSMYRVYFTESVSYWCIIGMEFTSTASSQARRECSYWLFIAWRGTVGMWLNFRQRDAEFGINAFVFECLHFVAYSLSENHTKKYWLKLMEWQLICSIV